MLRQPRTESTPRRSCYPLWLDLSRPMILRLSLRLVPEALYFPCIRDGRGSAERWAL